MDQNLLVKQQFLCIFWQKLKNWEEQLLLLMQNTHKCGDDTAKYMGRMTLNPFKHMDFLGAIMFIFFGFGWAKPVPVFEDFDKITITKIEDCFVVNSEFEKNFVPKNELKNYQMILQKLPSSNRVFFDKLCSENKVKITPSLETESFGIILDFISNTKLIFSHF